MNKLHFLIITLILSALTSFAQEKELTYYDLEIGRYYNLRPSGLQGLNWFDNDNISYVEDNRLIKAGIKNSDNKFTVVSLDELNKAATEIGIDSLRRFPTRYSVRNGSELLIRRDNSVYLYSILEKKLQVKLELPEDAENVEIFHSREKAVYRHGDYFKYVQEKNKSKEINLSEKKGHSYGTVVHRNEFGIANGAYWSPNGNKVAYYSNDESMVTPYPLVRIDRRVAEVEETYYPMAGMKSEEVEVLVYDLESGKNVTLKSGGDPEQYLTNISWSTDEKSIYVQQLNRAQNHMHLVKYDAGNGEVVDTLFEEKHEKYVEPLNLLVFSKKNTGDFYYQSARDGFNHIYYFDADKVELDQVTMGEWGVTDFIGFDANENYIYFMATKDSPLERHLYKVNLKNKKLTKLTKEPGVHRVQLSDDFKYFIDRYSSTTVPNKVQVVNTDGVKVADLHTAENPLAAYKLGKVESGTFLGGDEQTPLHYRMVLPVDFDPNKKYPVIFYIYGGPHAQMITNSWVGRTDLWFQHMAQNGFIGITMDTRGSANRGMEFENVIHRQSGIPQMEDIMKGVEFVSLKSYVDTERIGIHGWSYGGYMTTMMLTRHSETFKVGVAGGPVIDWKYYEVMYGERYMDTPQENPEGYKETDLKNYAGELKGKLKIIHGAVDPTVVWQHSQDFVQACIKAGTVPDLFFYPLHEHNVRGYDRVHLIKVISEYFKENL